MNFSFNDGTTSLNGSVDGGLIGGFFALLAGMWLIILAIVIISIIAQWKIFEKAGREGWKAIIPFYNMYVLTEIAGLNGWLFLLCLIPGVGALIWQIMVSLKLAPAFGKETSFAVGLILLPFIFELILAFGDSKYVLGAPAKSTSTAGKATSTSTKAKKTEDPWVNGKE